MLPRAATPSMSRSAPVVGRPPLGAVPVLTVVVVPPGVVPPGGVPPQLVVQPGGVPPQLVVQPGGVPPQSCLHGWQSLPMQWQLLPWHGWHCCPMQWQSLPTQWHLSPWHGWHCCPMQWQLSPWHSWHCGPWHSWHCGPWQPGWLQSLPMQEVEPPLQLALAKPPAATALPQTFTGTLTGAVTVLPETIGMLKFPVVLPLWLWPPTPEMVEVDPPTQPALEKPSSASEMPHRLTGALTGAVTVLPEPIGMLKFPVVLPLSLPLPTLEMVELDPPLQPEFAKPPTAPETPHTFTGALIGAVIVLPEPSEMLRLPVVLPLWLSSPTLEMVELDPPAQPAFEKPATASEIPHRLTGALSGAVTELPDRIEMLPFPVVFPLSEA